MSIFDKRKDTQPAEPTSTSSAPPGPRPRLPEAVSAAREIAAIGRTITINGDVTGEESLVIDGKVNGTVVLKKNDLTIGQAGHVTTDITANVVRVEGEVTGDITGAEKVVISRTGRVRGNVVAPRVTLEDGAKFKGSIDMDPEPAKPAVAPQALRSDPAGQPAAAPDQPSADVGKA
jgi:cytoskeletal protein CcmA (bactofilin family)